MTSAAGVHQGGKFIVVEGGDGSGKSTQARRLADRLRDAGHETVLTREPGGTASGAALRQVLLEGSLDARAEALLMAADRAQHVTEVIGPALARGAWVVSDRFVPSSLVYQGVGRALGVDAVEALSEFATAGISPDLVLVLDISEDVSKVRRASEDPDRFERESEEFHARVREAYRSLAAQRGWVVVDGSLEVDVVADEIWSVACERLEP